MVVFVRIQDSVTQVFVVRMLLAMVKGQGNHVVLVEHVILPANVEFRRWEKTTGYSMAVFGSLIRLGTMWLIKSFGLDLKVPHHLLGTLDNGYRQSRTFF
jgi:hypothetical protein